MVSLYWLLDSLFCMCSCGFENSKSCFLYLADVTEVLYKLEINIEKVKISTTPDGKVMDLFFVTDTRYV